MRKLVLRSILLNQLHILPTMALDTPVRLKDRTELGLLARTMNRMSRGLREAQKQKAEKDRLAHEVDLAREIQSSLLPAEDLRA